MFVFLSCVLSQGELHQAWESSQDVNPVYPEEMVVFHSYVSLPEGNRLNHSGSVFPPKVACFINTRSEQKRLQYMCFFPTLKKTYLQITMFVYFTQGINRQQSPSYLILTIHQGRSPGDG